MTLLGYVAVGHTKQYSEIKWKKKIPYATIAAEIDGSRHVFFQCSLVLWGLFLFGLILVFCLFCFVFSFSLDCNFAVELEYSNL